MLFYYFSTFCPLLAFFHPACLLIFRKISTLLVYSIPARFFHPACYFHPARLLLFYKKVLTSCSFSFDLFIFDLHLVVLSTTFILYKCPSYSIIVISSFLKLSPCWLIRFSNNLPCSIINFQKNLYPARLFHVCSIINF